MSDPAACQAFRLALSAEFDGEVPATAGAAAAYDPAHDTKCPACRAFRHDLERLRRPLREARDQPLPGPLRERLRQVAVAGPRRRSHDSPQTAPLDHAPGGWLAALAARPLLMAGTGVGLLIVLLFLAVHGRSDRPMAPASVHLRQATLAHGVLTIDTDGEAILSTAAGRSLRLWGGPGQITIAAFTDTEVDLRQDRGRLCARWSSRSPIPFRLQAGLCHIEVRGTVWRLAFDPGNESILEVAEGQVLLVTPTGRHDVPALRRVRFSSDGAMIASEAFNPFADPQFQLSPDQVVVDH
ncbi:MAG: hypothetical protein OZSIB_3481 [Candidatus Ozemobacter sibiricus]|uniref:FecR protein domain-containing protein n=1 Tax=Candidatus Ozemobacter sibiricus TaxID=2268124 RepID=A0A367ZRD6_9BACT|nr:MAG: hypothetical protein OZSIB_3481 [Candidatus Ozemobacter sibiricus]